MPPAATAGMRGARMQARFALAAFAADLEGADRWSVPLAEPSVEVADLDGDGVRDERATASDGGSGYRTWTTCVRHGASGHVACERVDSTPYSLFTGVQRVLVPTGSDRAGALLGPARLRRSRPGEPGPGRHVEAAGADPGAGALRACAGLVVWPPPGPGERLHVAW